MQIILLDIRGVDFILRRNSGIECSKWNPQSEIKVCGKKSIIGMEWKYKTKERKE